MKPIHTADERELAARVNARLRSIARGQDQQIQELDEVSAVFVAEDDEDLRQLLCAALRREGYLVRDVASGAELCEWLATAVIGGTLLPDLIVSDIRMPGANGLDVVASLRKADWAMPVILITAFGDRAIHAEAQRLGVADVLDKPFAVDDLVAAVRAVVLPRIDARERPKVKVRRRHGTGSSSEDGE